VPTRVDSLPSASNLLHVSVEQLEGERPQTAPHHQLLCATTADRRLHLFVPDQAISLVKSINHLQDSPILSCISYGHTKKLITITSGMSGQTVLYDHEEDRALDERRDHKKYVVRIASTTEGSTTWIATAGWDSKVFLYRIISGSEIRMGAPVASITTVTNPESITFLKHPDRDRPILVVTRRDSTSLHYYALPMIDRGSAGTSTPPPELVLLGSQNLAPHSNACRCSVAHVPHDLRVWRHLSGVNAVHSCLRTQWKRVDLTMETIIRDRFLALFDRPLPTRSNTISCSHFSCSAHE